MQMQYLDTLRKGLIVCLIFSGDCLSHNKTIGGGYPTELHKISKKALISNVSALLTRVQ